MAAVPRIADTSIEALMDRHCCTQESISNIPRTATARDGSSERPAGEFAAVGMFQQRGTSIAAYLTTGGHYIEKEMYTASKELFYKAVQSCL